MPCTQVTRYPDTRARQQESEIPFGGLSSWCLQSEFDDICFHYNPGFSKYFLLLLIHTTVQLACLFTPTGLFLSGTESTVSTPPG